MNMVKEKSGKTSRKSEYTYELLDKQADRAAGLLYNRWSSFFNQLEQNESFLLGRMKVIYAYARQISGDGYMRNISLVFIGCRNSGKPVKVSLEKMEHLRLFFIEENKIQKQGGKKRVADPKQIERPGDEVKIKYLMRLAVAVRLADMIYQRLLNYRLKAGDKLLGEDFRFSSFPLLFESQLKQFLQHFGQHEPE